MVRFILPFLNFAINALVLYKLSALLSAYFEFEYLMLCLFFAFFCMNGIHGLFKGIFTFLENRNTFNLLFVVQLFTSVLVMQLMGFLFTLYLTFVMMLIYLMWTKQAVIYNFFLHVCGIVIGAAFLLIMFY